MEEMEGCGDEEEMDADRRIYNIEMQVAEASEVCQWLRFVTDAWQTQVQVCCIEERQYTS